MKSFANRNWLKMSMHGKKEFLAHNGFDKKMATSTWDNLTTEVKKKFELEPVVKVESENAKTESNASL